MSAAASTKPIYEEIWFIFVLIIIFLILIVIIIVCCWRCQRGKDGYSKSSNSNLVLSARGKDLVPSVPGKDLVPSASSDIFFIAFANKNVVKPGIE